MNLKKSLVGIVAGLALVGSIAAPAAQVSAGEGGDSAQATINITTDGIFDLDITSNIEFGDFLINASNAWDTPSVSGTLFMTYTDTKNRRGQFDTSLTATNFQSNNSAAWTPIPASGFLVTYLPNPQQTQCCGSNYGIGGISNRQANHGVIGDDTSSSSADWGAGIPLSEGPYIHRGWPGIGTVQTLAQANVKLMIPSNTSAGWYESTVTATVTFSAP